MLTLHAKRRCACLIGAALLAGCAADDPGPQPGEMIVETAQLPIDRIYTSMAGPADRVPVDIESLDWVTALSVDVIDGQTGEPMGDEFFCHSQLQLLNSTRLMVTATGTAGIRFPDGFGLPVTDILSFIPENERVLSFYGMVLNNHIADIDRAGSVRAKIEYWANEDLVGQPPLKSLYKAGSRCSALRSTSTRRSPSSSISCRCRRGSASPATGSPNSRAIRCWPSPADRIS